MTLAALGCSTPPGRFGTEPLCAPVVMADPFVHDQCVPPKGVDFGNFGYVRPMWGVLEGPPAPCCGPGGLPSIAPDAMIEVLPEEQEPRVEPVEADALRDQPQPRPSPLPRPESPFGSTPAHEENTHAQVSGQTAIHVAERDSTESHQSMRSRLNELVEIEVDDDYWRR